MYSARFFTVAAFVLASLSGAQAVSHAAQATWYQPNGGLGACGAPSKNSDLVVALPSNRYNGGKHCWQHIGIWYKNKYVDATVVDMCPGCDSNHIDISEGTFKRLENLGTGVIEVTWAFV